jgi:hypothetical protein
MEDIISRPVLDGPDLDAAIAHARAALTALLRVPAGGDGAGRAGTICWSWNSSIAPSRWPGPAPGVRRACARSA